MTDEPRDPGAERASEPQAVSESFLRGVVASQTSYSEGWREVCARLLWVEEQLAALRASLARAERELDEAVNDLRECGRW